jgi:hypothetical protein
MLLSSAYFKIGVSAFVKMSFKECFSQRMNLQLNWGGVFDDYGIDWIW